MIVNIFTGGKGGIGKTLNALCCSVHYLKNSENVGVNIIDLNYTNPDLFKIFYGQKLNENEAEERGFIVKEIGKGTKGSKIICKKDLFAVPQGNLGIWKEIVAVVEASNDKDVLVIDSNFNIASLLYLTDAWDGRKIAKMIKKSQIERIRIWLVWSFNMLTEIGEYDRFLQENSVKTFEEISEGKFKEKRDLIHILNPYKYFRDDEYQTINDLIKNMVQQLGNREETDKEAITFHQLVYHFTEAFKACQRSQSGPFLDLLQRITASYRLLPFNMCFIPFYQNEKDSKNVQNYIENLSANPPDDLGGLINDIRVIYDAISLGIGKNDELLRQECSAEYKKN